MNGAVKKKSGNFCEIIGSMYPEIVMHEITFPLGFGPGLEPIAPGESGTNSILLFFYETLSDSMTQPKKSMPL